MEKTKTRQEEIKIVNLTEKAVSQVSTLLDKEQKDRERFGLRLAIKGGGCSGFSYDLKFDEMQEKDFIQVFSEMRSENDTEQSQTKVVRVFIDPKSGIYLKGMTVDFDDGLMGKGFVFKNPNATNTCGCGESFSVF